VQFREHLLAAGERTEAESMLTKEPVGEPVSFMESGPEFL
jgi:hypothetical protein